MNYKKEIDVLLDKYTDDELINFEFELHDVITTELNYGHLHPDEIKRYRNLGYDVEESK